MQACCPEHSSWPPSALCSLAECSHPLGRPGWGLHLAPPATLQAPVLDQDLLCPDKGHPETGLTGEQETRAIMVSNNSFSMMFFYLHGYANLLVFGESCLQ